MSLPGCRIRVVSSELSLPTCRFQVVASKLSLPSCRFQVVASELSLPNCRFRVVASELSLPSCRFQVVASELSLPSCRFRVVASKLSLPSCQESLGTSRWPPPSYLGGVFCLQTHIACWKRTSCRRRKPERRQTKTKSWSRSHILNRGQNQKKRGIRKKTKETFKQEDVSQVTPVNTTCGQTFRQTNNYEKGLNENEEGLSNKSRNKSPTADIVKLSTIAANLEQQLNNLDLFDKPFLLRLPIRRAFVLSLSWSLNFCCSRRRKWNLAKAEIKPCWTCFCLTAWMFF